MNGSFDASTLVFAILAIFVVWKLRSVLGTRTGTERPPFNPFAKRTPAEPPQPGERGKVIPLPGAAERFPDQSVAANDGQDRWTGFAERGSPVAKGLDDIARADRNFAVQPFMDGARMAYETIILAFAKGDKAALAPLLAKDVFDGFASAVDQRERKGERVETTFVSMDKSTIEDAQVRGRSEQVAIRFETKLITVTRDGAGVVVDGNPETVSDIIDVWTFARDMDSRDPNWKLVATESGQ